MRHVNTAFWKALLRCGVAALPGVAPAAPPPTVQTMLAAQDADHVKRIVSWNAAYLALPDDMVLDAPLREAVEQLLREHMQRMPGRVQSWIAEERAAAKDQNLRGAALDHALFVRSLNEAAIASVESTGSAHDEAALKAALAPTACRLLYPSHFLRRIGMIQAAPAEARPALLAAEKELLSRWGSAHQGLAPRPSAAELVAADHAITQLREGLPVTAAPMAPHLAGSLFSRDRKAGPSDRWERCAKSQWWLQSQLAEPKAERTQALTVFRYSTMTVAGDFVPADYKPKSAPPRPDGKPAYPRAATMFDVKGVITLQVDIDNQGKAVKADVIERQIRVPGLHSGRPVAFETVFDEAALDYARRRAYPAGAAKQARFELEWNLSEVGSDGK